MTEVIAALRLDIRNKRQEKRNVYEKITQEKKYRIHSIIVHTGHGRTLGHYYTFVAQWIPSLPKEVRISSESGVPFL